MAFDPSFTGESAGEPRYVLFEYSTLQATVKGHLTSVKNPTGGSISAGLVGEIIIDENIKKPANCRIEVTDIK